jgi:hypothetical protein
MPGAKYLSVFRLETGLPVWRYEVKGIVLEKRLYLLHLQNTYIYVPPGLRCQLGPTRPAPISVLSCHEGLVSEPRDRMR